MSQDPQARVLIIANSIFPYGYDAVRVLSLPDDAWFRARFDEGFVSAQIQRDYAKMGGFPGLYCFRDYQTGLIVPLRHITISSISPIGSVYFIEYQVKSMLDFPQDTKSFGSQVSRFNQEFSSSHQSELKENEPGRDLKPLVLLSSSADTFKGNIERLDKEFDVETRRWSAVVRRLGEFSYFNFVPFVRITGIRTLGTTTHAPLKSGMAVRDNTKYQLQFIHNLQSDSLIEHSINEQRTERDASFVERANYELTLTCDDPSVQIFRRSVRITGSYDVNHYSFYIPPISKRTSIEFNIDYSGDRPPKLDSNDTSVAFRLDVGPSIKFPAGRAVILAIFALIYAIPNLFPVLLQGSEELSSIIRDMGLLAVAITAFDFLNEFRRFWASRGA